MNNLQVIYSLILLGAFLLLKLIINQAIGQVVKSLDLSRNRKKIILKLVNILLMLLFLIGLGIIWQINSKDFYIFLSSILAVIGVAFVAQWSLLSNVTAAFILFFSHPLKIGDKIKILDKDFPIEGEVRDITAFFIYIKTQDKMDISIPNNILLQKSISVLEKAEE